ncbi:oxidoreductase [Alloactinosynnema sp. L-07]|uniref:aldo/keto reductase n=1 Tax=Alloactinosynnema sp. L-07 TaxID=1653480 RepID=UPI00065EF7C3|nr:aldo/keto reductase [Alloactinosynnema sp. L-07]CRK57491.1 oxidoreductase [Alloactinosynnema sp. L-07]
MRTRMIGSVEVSAIGLGGMPLSVTGRPDRERAIATVRAAVDAGITFIDSADAYSLTESDFGHNEDLIAEALRGVDAEVLVATKGGHTRGPGDEWHLDGRPEHLRAACEASLRRLGVDAIGLYQFHRPDPKVPIEDSVGALADLLDAGKIRMAGVSNFNPAQIATANEILGGRLAAVQNQFSPVFRSSEPELRLCADLGIAFLPWSPFGGIRDASALGSRFAAFAEVAARRGVSPQRVCLAWMLAKAPVVIPIPGSSRPASIQDSAAATELALESDEMAVLDTRKP